MWQLLFILLPLAAASGWYFASRQHKMSVAPAIEKARFADDYFLGLNYLINEQPDKAVDVFIKLLEIDSSTVEMHLALGSLFRRKGEVDRAIKIHQNLIARPQLTHEQRVNALFELAQDYLRAGVLDRAEKLFLDLLALNEDDITGYKFLLNIYEKQKDWRQAIAMAQKLLGFSEEAMWVPIAHYYCELADEAISQGLIEQAEIYFKKSLAQDKNCVRASIGLGKLMEKVGNVKIAVRFYKQVRDQDIDFLSEVAPLLAKCYEANGYDVKDLVAFLQDSLGKTYNGSLMLFLVKYIYKQYGREEVMNFVVSHNRLDGSLRTLSYLLELCSQSIDDEKIHSNLQLVQKFLNKFLENKSYYRCNNCGLGTRQLYWQCPGCRRWASLKPIRKFEIEK